MRREKGVRRILLLLSGCLAYRGSRALLPVPIPIFLLLFQSWCGHAVLSRSCFKGCPPFRTFCSGALLSHCNVLPHSMHSHSYAFAAFYSYSLGICKSWKVLGFRLLPWSCFCTGLLVLGIFAKNIVPGFLCIGFFIYFKALLNYILLEWLIVTWLVNRTYWDKFKILSVPHGSYCVSHVPLRGQGRLENKYYFARGKTLSFPFE